MTSRSEVNHANHYTIEASYKKGQIFYVELYNVLLFCEVKIKMHITYNEWILAPKASHTRKARKMATGGKNKESYILQYFFHKRLF